MKGVHDGRVPVRVDVRRNTRWVTFQPGSLVHGSPHSPADLAVTLASLPDHSRVRCSSSGHAHRRCDGDAGCSPGTGLPATCAREGPHSRSRPMLPQADRSVRLLHVGDRLGTYRGRDHRMLARRGVAPGAPARVGNTRHKYGAGNPEPWAPATAISFQWTVSAVPETVEGNDFQICVDQVEVVP